MKTHQCTFLCDRSMGMRRVEGWEGNCENAIHLRELTVSSKLLSLMQRLYLVKLRNMKREFQNFSILAICHGIVKISIFSWASGIENHSWSWRGFSVLLYYCMLQLYGQSCCPTVSYLPSLLSALLWACQDVCALRENLLSVTSSVMTSSEAMSALGFTYSHHLNHSGCKVALWTTTDQGILQSWQLLWYSRSHKCVLSVVYER